jgi:serine phosphatase RsbU (regulator of sigma subunit)
VLLDALSPALDIETTLPDATVEEEAWMLTALLQVTEAISGPQATQDSLDDMLARVVRVVPLLAGVDRCTVYLEDGTGQGYTPGAWYPRGEMTTAPGADLSALRQASATLQPVVLADTASARAVLPMTTQGRVFGLMQVDVTGGGRSFSPKEAAILSNIASQAAVGIENIRLRQEAVERARLESELQMAHDVQASLLPPCAPHVPGWDIACSWQAASSVGGDFYDFIALPHGRLGIVVADVAGKGMSAALFMALARSIVRANVARGGSAARAIERANRLICDDAHDGTFVTLFYGIVAADSPPFVYTNAGHNPPILAGALGPTLLDGRGMALGIHAPLSLDDASVEVQEGDALVLYTDGLTEAINSRQEQFGIERLAQVIQANRRQPAHLIIRETMQAIADFVGDQQAFDDATIVVAKRVHADHR